MTSPDMPRHVEVGDGDQPVAAAEVTTAAGADGTVRASLHASAGHLTPGSRASLVDAVMDLPEVQASTRLEATIPLGDGESLERLRERTEDAVTRSAGSTTLLDANIPAGSQPEPGVRTLTPELGQPRATRWSGRPRLARSTDAPEVRLAGRSRPGDPWHPDWR